MPIGFVKRCSNASIIFLNPICALCLRAHLSCNVIGDQHGQRVVRDFPLAIHQFDHTRTPTMTQLLVEQDFIKPSSLAFTFPVSLFD